MKIRLLLTMLIATGFAPTKANMFEDLAEHMKSVAVDAKDATVNLAYKVKKNTWNAPALGYRHGGKILTSGAIGLLAADQLYSWHLNKQIRETEEFQKWRNADKNKYKDDYEYPLLRRTLPQEIQNLWRKKVPRNIRYAVSDVKKVALSIGISVIMYTIINKGIEGNLVPAHFKLAKPEEIDTTFDSVIGAENAKEQINQFIDYVKNTQKYKDIGAKPLTGCILYGPPGTGKTDLARATAKASNLNLIYLNGSDFNGVWRGSGTSQIRKLEKFAHSHAPALVFIDEIDSAVSKQKEFGSPDTGATTNKFKALLDGFEKQNPNKPIFFMGATNNLKDIDPAITRDGRLSPIEISAPTKENVEKIIASKLYQGQVQTEPGINTAKIAYQVYKPGYTGANVATLVNQAAMIAAANNKLKVDRSSIDKAIEMIAARA